MRERRSERTASPVLRLAPEDHVCPACEIDYETVTVPDAVETLRTVPERVRGAAEAVPAPLRRRRPDPATWSVVEYVCHVRDIYATYTIRVHRARTEDRPTVDPMLNDLRARRFRYNERDLAAVLDELGANLSGFLEEVGELTDGDLDRTITRLPDETRNARWLVRQAMHEGVHHARDIAVVGHALQDDRAE